MNFGSFDAYPYLKQAAEDAYEAQDDQTDDLIRKYPAATRPQIAIEMLYHLMVLLFWNGARDFAESATVRMDPERQGRMRRLAEEVSAKGISAVPEMKAAEIRALCWGPLPGTMARDISRELDERLEAYTKEMRLTHLYNEVAAAASRVEDMLDENVVLYVYGRAQTRDLIGRTEGLAAS